MADDPLPAHYKRRLAASLDRYERTGNPLYLWSAYDTARQGRLPIPEEVLAYFDSVANGFVEISAKQAPAEKLYKRIAQVLGFKTPGPETAISRWHREWEQLQMAWRVEALLRKGKSKSRAFEEVADLVKRDKRTVSRAWQNHRSEIGH